MFPLRESIERRLREAWLGPVPLILLVRPSRTLSYHES
jgi:hypothetical protein